MRNERRAVVVGATGLVGGHLLKQLCDNPKYSSVTAVVRRPGALGAWARDAQASGRLREAVVDFEALSKDSTAAKAFTGDDLYCALGTTIKVAGSKDAFRRVDHDYVVESARAARAAGAAKLLLVSSVGADAKSPFFYNQVKGEVERDVASLGFAEVHVFRPSFLAGERIEHRPGEKVALMIGKCLGPIARLPLVRDIAPVPAEAVARAMVRAALAAESRPGVSVHASAELARS
ncbi:MAG TPA: NAD(P)H-binding protein [Bdellovibrionota bacterium]|jgi:uncharacterized protein YbjT (DUF2867 family)|nr:NAD(P)H-binding protein [Bdellovibrionota bacterium]